MPPFLFAAVSALRKKAIISSAFLLRSGDMLGALSVLTEAGTWKAGVMGMIRKHNIVQFHGSDSVPARLSVVVGENLRALRRKLSDLGLVRKPGAAR